MTDDRGKNGDRVRPEVLRILDEVREMLGVPRLRLVPPPVQVGRITDGTRRAFAVLRALTADERCAVLCWFCGACGAYAGPGSDHVCAEPEGA
jgi:hypothetical protein